MTIPSEIVQMFVVLAYAWPGFDLPILDVPGFDLPDLDRPGFTDPALRWLHGAFLPLGKGATILVVGGFFSLGFSFLWSVVSKPLVTPVRPLRGDGLGRPLLGAFAGAIAAFLTYWAGAALIAVVALMQAPVQTLPYEFSRPFHTFYWWEVVLVAFGAMIGAIIARYRWHGAGILGYVGLLSMISGYLVYSITVSIPQVPADERWISYVLLAAETGGLTLIAIFAFYTIDAAMRRHWRRRPETIPYDPDYLPVVAFQVPVFNEPPEMVEQTVAHLVEQDYPRDRFLVVVADDSTDEEIRRKNKAMCERYGVHHVTRPKRNGFKAGALNYVTARLVDEVEFVAVIDADYWVHPDYLKSVVGYFVDPKLSFVQTPQDYRNIDESFLTRRYKHAESYFYHSIMPSRNEENTIIFCGTMGMIRRSALEQVGGFAEDQICEDAEISVRLAIDGWHSLYIDKSFGKGLMPPVFDAYKKQFYRWAFGNVKIMFSHTKGILKSNMTKRQKVDYMVSNFHWFDGYFVLAIALVLLYLGLGPLLGYEAVTHHQRELVLLAIVPMVLLMDSIFRLHLVLNRMSRKISWGETFMVQGMWFAIKMTNIRAVTKCLLGFKTPFIRTPKAPSTSLSVPKAFVRAVRLTKFESFLGVSLLAVAVYNLQPGILVGEGLWTYLLPAWLALYSLIFFTAPIYAYMSYRTIGKTAPEPRPVWAPSGAPHRVADGRSADAFKGSGAPGAKPVRVTWQQT